MIIGHQKIVSYFNALLENGALAQAYCFVGPDGVGKRALANYLSAKLLGVNEKQLKTHPDFSYIVREEDEKSGKLKKDISIKQARDLCEHLRHKSWLGGYNVVVIDEAELLNDESGNALLKSIEEAGKKTVFFLLTTNDGALLPTIRSRCQIFFFSLVPTEEIKSGLKQLNYDDKTAEESSDISWGRPGRGVMFANDAEARSGYRKEMERWKKISDMNFHDRIKNMEELLGDKTDTMRTRDALIQKIEIWTMLWRDVLRDSCGTNTVTPDEIVDSIKRKINISRDKITGLLEFMREMRGYLKQNINPRLLVEELLLKLD